MNRFFGHRQKKGSVVLVAMCCLAVLGIALASYLAVSSQAMKLANRNHQASVAKQLAEIGIEQALWSFAWKNWSAWDTTTSPTSATKLISFPDGKFGNGITASVKIRVDNYKAAIWDGLLNHSASEHIVMWYQGVWYQCVLDDTTSSTPTEFTAGGKWMGAPAAWVASATYRPKNIVLYQGLAYQCQAANINKPPPDAAYWTSLGAVGAWSSSTSYSSDQTVLLGSVCYRSIGANANKPPPDPQYWVCAPTLYSEGAIFPPESSTNAIKSQVRAFVAPASLFPNAIAATATVNITSSNPTGLVDSYDSSLGTYASSNPNDRYSAVIAGKNQAGTAVLMAGGTVQGYISAPSSSVPPYGPNVSLAGKLIGSATGSGIDATRISRSPYFPVIDPAQWNPNSGYLMNDVVTDGSDLFVCKTAHINQDPSNTVYWTKNTVLTLPSNSNIDLGTVGASVPKAYNITSPSVTGVDLDGASESITIKSPVVLNIPGYFRTRNGGKIIIAPTGSLQIFMNGRLRIEGDGGIENQTLDPKKLVIINTAKATPGTHRFNTKTPFFGAIYMPSVTSSLNFSNITGDPEIFGAISASVVNINSTPNFHYDTSPRNMSFLGMDLPFVVTELRELTEPAEKTLLP